MGLVNFPTSLIFICLLAIHKGYAGQCQDQLSNCPDYANLCSYDNVQKQCPLTCTLCVNVSPSSTVIPVTSSHYRAPTESTTSINTQGTDNNREWNNHNTTVKATATSMDFSQTNVLMLIGLFLSCLLSRH